MDRKIPNAGSTICNTLNVTTLSEEVEAKEQDDSESIDNLSNAPLHSFNHETCCLKPSTSLTNNIELMISKNNSNAINSQRVKTCLPKQPNYNWETQENIHTRYKPVEGDPNQASANKENVIVTKDAFGVNTHVTLSNQCSVEGSHSTAV